MSTTGYRLLDKLLSRVNGQRPEPPPPPGPPTLPQLWRLVEQMVSGTPIDAFTNYDAWAHRYETIERAANTPWLIAWPDRWPGDDVTDALIDAGAVLDAWRAERAVA